jgi:hypothetical protein
MKTAFRFGVWKSPEIIAKIESIIGSEKKDV